MLAQKKTENAIGLLFWMKLFDYRRIGGLDSFQQALKTSIQGSC